MKRLLAILTSAFFILTAVAQNADPLKINFMAFTHITSQNLAKEKWPDQLIVPNKPGAIHLVSANAGAMNQNQYGVYTMPIQYRLLSPAQVGQSWLVHKLAQTNNTLIMNIAWLQPSQGQSAWIHIVGGQGYNAQGQPTSTPSSIVFWELNGFLKITGNRYFTVEGQLYLTEPTTLGDIDPGRYGLIPLKTYTLESTEQLRLGQTAYFDHPLFGALLTITSAHG